MSKADLIEIIENQKLALTYERARRKQLEETISNKKLPINMRQATVALTKLVDTGTPDENGWYRAHLPNLATTGGSSASTMSRAVRNFADCTGAIEIRKEPDKHDPFKEIIYIKPTAILDKPADIEPIKEIKRHGGDHRIARCNGCGSENIVETKKWICADCGQVHKTFEDRSVNHPLQDAMGESESDALQDATYTVDTLVSIADEPVARCNALLDELKSLPIWVCWKWEPDEKTGKPTKVPYIAELVRYPQKAKSNDLKTGRPYDQAYAIYDQSIQEGWKKPYDGIGLLCNGEFTGIDLDHCRNKETGEIAQWAQDIIERFASLTYITPSEEGVRIIIQNKKPGPRCKKGNIEVYDQERFFTWTNNHLTGTPETIESRQEELDAFYGEVFGQDIPNQTPTPSTLNVPPQKQKSCIGNALEKARQASNGSGEKFIRLYDEGNWNGYYSQSEADQALFEILLYWTDGDVSTSDDLFKKSGLMRPKWNRDDYRKSTINGAMKFYLESQERRAS